ncbi:MAG: hypothetical protein H0X62_03745 [Bacteroidetes bacterium]|nr:hypothetical protein [Bacteroidota bacterium]
MKKVILPAALLIAFFTTETVVAQTQKENTPAATESKEIQQKPAQGKVGAGMKAAPEKAPANKNAEPVQTTQPAQRAQPAERAQPAQPQPATKAQPQSEASPAAPAPRKAESAPDKNGEVKKKEAVAPQPK